MESRSQLVEVVTLPVPFETQPGEGTLFILGGGVTPQIVYDEYFRIAGGPKARVYHIPSATISFEEIPDRHEHYIEFYEQKPELFEFLHTYDRAVSESAEFAAPIDTATGLWMGGGDQRRLAMLFNDTHVPPAMHRLLDRGGIISGTSSGTAVMSDVMINIGYEEIEYGKGFNLYPKTICDPHFTGRERHKRVGRSVLRYPDQMGVGIDEKTSLVIHGNKIGMMGLEGRSAWYHFAYPDQGVVHRYHILVGETIELPVRARGADHKIVEEALRAVREPEVLTSEKLFEPDTY